MQHSHDQEELAYITIVVEHLSDGLVMLGEVKEPKQQLYRFFLRDAVLLMYNLLERRRGVLKMIRKEEDSTNNKYLADSGHDVLSPERIAYLKEIK